MDEKNHNPMTNSKIASYDNINCTNYIRMLKICSYYVPAAYQKMLNVYIKFMELRYVWNTPSPAINTNAAFRTAENVHEDGSDNNHAQAFSAMIHELLPYCSPQEKQKFQNIENMLNSFEQMKNMMEMMEMMKDMKDMFGGEEGGFTPDILAGMMGMDGFDINNMFQN